MLGAGRRDGGVAAGPRLPASPGRSGSALPDALLLPPWSPGRGSRARGRPVCGVTGCSGEAGIDGGLVRAGSGEGAARARGAGEPHPPLLPPSPPPV